MDVKKRIIIFNRILVLVKKGLWKRVQSSNNHMYEHRRGRVGVVFPKMCVLMKGTYDLVSMILKLKW